MYTKEELNKMTKNDLLDLARKNKIPGIVNRMNKQVMVEALQEKLETRQIQQDDSKVAVQLFNNIYYPQTGRLLIGVHLVSKEIAQDLTNKLSDQVIKIITPEAVAAYYGLDDGNST